MTCNARACAAALLILPAALSLAACAGTVAAYPYQNEPDPRLTEYVIGVADDLQISVWKNRELDTKISVRPDGHITMPLVGDVKAEGLTPTELRREIASKLSRFIREEDAVVTVAVTGVNSYYVTVAGNVAAPGRFTSTTYLTVADAIALAGGPTRFAEPSDAVLFRRLKNGKTRRIPINYERILQGRNLEQNLVLMRGDRVFVP